MADEARNVSEAQRRPRRRDRWTRVGAPDGQVAPESFTDGQGRAGTEGATGGREDAESGSTNDHVAGAGSKPDTRRTGKQRSPQDHRRGIRRADGGINAGSAADAYGTAGGEDRRYDGRYRKRGAVTGAAEGHRAAEGERRRA